MMQENFDWSRYITQFSEYLSFGQPQIPWRLTSQAVEIITKILPTLPDDYKIEEGIAIHRTAIVEENVALKAPVIIGAKCFIAANCYLRGGVFLIANNSIGPGCEMKSSFIFPHSNLAHFNFVGDSVIGSNVNFEAGSIIANHFNERNEKEISVLIDGQKRKTGVQKFGAVVGDGSTIGANAVLSPGTLLFSNTHVKRLELVNQLGND